MSLSLAPSSRPATVRGAAAPERRAKAPGGRSGVLSNPSSGAFQSKRTNIARKVTYANNFHAPIRGRESRPQLRAQQTRLSRGAAVAPARRGRRPKPIADRQFSPRNRELCSGEQGSFWRRTGNVRCSGAAATDSAADRRENKRSVLPSPEFPVLEPLFRRGRRSLARCRTCRAWRCRSSRRRRPSRKNRSSTASEP